jgi:hypothetical protein
MIDNAGGRDLRASAAAPVSIIGRIGQTRGLARVFPGEAQLNAAKQAAWLFASNAKPLSIVRKNKKGEDPRQNV